MVGLYKYRGAFLFSILPDFVCLLCLLLHRFTLKAKGLWLSNAEAKRVRADSFRFFAKCLV